MRVIILFTLTVLLCVGCKNKSTHTYIPSNSIIDLSLSLKPGVYNSDWKDKQEQWTQKVLAANSAKDLAPLVLEFTTYLNQDKISPKWGAMKFVWEEEIAAAKQNAQVRYLIIELEEYLRPAMQKNWEKKRPKWYTAIDEFR